MQPNAILTVAFLRDEYSFPVVWNEYSVYSSEDSGDDVCERIFFSDEFEKEWDECRPNLDVTLMNCPEVTSRVYFDQEGGLYSNISLNHFLHLQKQ
jgi:hypothetical protein